MLFHQFVAEPDAPQETWIFVHGFLGSGRNLSSLAKLVSQDRPHAKVLFVDLPGHGQSEALPPEASMQTVAEIVLEGLEDLELPRPWTWVGHSLGGRIGLVALDGESAPEHLVLLDIAPGSIPAGKDVTQVLELLLSAPEVASDRSQMREHFLSQGLSRPLTDWLLMNLVRTEAGLGWRFSRQDLAAAHRRWTHQSLWEGLRRPERVEMLVYGEKSDFHSPEDRARLAQAGTRVEGIPGVGHFVHAEALAETRALLAQLPPRVP